MWFNVSLDTLQVHFRNYLTR